jgi:hypothetical protein
MMLFGLCSGGLHHIDPSAKRIGHGGTLKSIARGNLSGKIVPALETEPPNPQVASELRILCVAILGSTLDKTVGKSEPSMFKTEFR